MSKILILALAWMGSLQDRLRCEPGQSLVAAISFLPIPKVVIRWYNRKSWYGDTENPLCIVQPAVIGLHSAKHSISKRMGMYCADPKTCATNLHTCVHVIDFSQSDCADPKTCATNLHTCVHVIDFSQSGSSAQGQGSRQYTEYSLAFALAFAAEITSFTQ